MKTVQVNVRGVVFLLANGKKVKRMFEMKNFIKNYDKN